MDAYSVEDIASQLGWGERRVRRLFARWARRGYPRVFREEGMPGDARGRLMVDAREFWAEQNGQLQAEPLDEAA